MRYIFQAFPVCLGAAAVAFSVWNHPARAQSMTLEDQLWSARASMAQNSSTSDSQLSDLINLTQQTMSNYQRASLGWTLAQGARSTPDSMLSKRLSQAADQVLAPFSKWLSSYGQLQEMRGKREPVWIEGDPEAISLAILGWIAIDRGNPAAPHRNLIAKFSEGIATLRHPDPSRYPFCTHVSFSPKRDVLAYAPLLERQIAMVSSISTDVQPASIDDSQPPLPTPAPEPVSDVDASGPPMVLREIGRAPGAEWFPAQSRQVQALADASLYLKDPELLTEAQDEALGMWTHLVVAGQEPYCFAPMPVGATTPKAVAVTVENMMALYRATNTRIYAELAGIAARGVGRLNAKKPGERSAIQIVNAVVRDSPAAAWLQFKESEPPVTVQIMEAEKGRAVQKAFELVNVTYPGGTPGQMARVGRENMFWMRFDVDREDDYFFHLISLKSHLEGGLISVQMRIDGDKIFKVPLGGATDPYVDMELVDGPRRLRQGPHSFGIRFSGLLMTQPALLDSVVAWPVVERRMMKLPNGSSALLLHNCSPNPARTSFSEIKNWPPPSMNVVDGNGAAATITRESDKRRHKEYIVMPAAGTALLQWRDS